MHRYKFPNRISRRSETGTSILELVASMFTFAIVAVICVNIGVLSFAAWRNDQTCRDACRAAAQRTNANDAKEAAKLVINQNATMGGGIFGNPVLLDGESQFEFQTFPDEDGAPQIDQNPFVRITTRLSSRLPAPIVFNGVGFTDVINFSQSYAYPILNPSSTVSDEIDEGVVDEPDPGDIGPEDDVEDDEVDA